MRQVPPAYTPTPPSALVALAAPPSGASETLRAVLTDLWGERRIELLGSGTQSLQRALTLASTGKGAPEERVVAMPGWGCFDLASAVVGAGVGVRLYDLEPETLQPDPSSLKRAAAGADAVVVVSFFGIPVEPERIPAEVGSEGGPWLIHDAAQAHGTEFGERSIEARADATVLSFGRGKGWTGLSGGALLLSSGRARESAAATPVTGGDSGGVLDVSVSGAKGVAQWALGRPGVYGIPARIPALGLGETHYHPPTEPAGLTEGAAGVLLATRADADAEARHRRARGTELQRLLESEAGRSLAPIRVAAGARPGYLRLPALDRGGADRDAGRPWGVLPSYPRPLRLLDPLKRHLRDADPTPGSDALAERLLTLPTHSRCSASDRRGLEAWVTRAPSSRAP